MLSIQSYQAPFWCGASLGHYAAERAQVAWSEFRPWTEVDAPRYRCAALPPRSHGRSLMRLNSAPRTTSPNAHMGPRMAKTVKPYDACWKSAFPWSRSVARPTCITVSTKPMKTVAAGHPGEVIAEEAAVAAQAADVRVEGPEAGEAVDGVDAGEAELGMNEAPVDVA